jgi:aspartyl-tRNA(Asn)/glutamyl-tRNA(Gln) amidotransferase subunit C
MYYCVPADIAAHWRRHSGSLTTHEPRNDHVSLDKEQVHHIALLARLKLSDEEYVESVEKLSKIVDFVDQLSEADTKGVVPMAHPLDAAQRLRPDVVTETNNRDRYQENAAAVSDGLYLVPKVLE